MKHERQCFIRLSKHRELAFHFDICQWCFISIIQPAYKYVSSSLWPSLILFELKKLTFWNQVGGEWERVSCHGNRTFFHSRWCVSSRTISLPRFNDLCCKLAKIAPFTYLIYCWVECMTASISHLIWIFYTLQYGKRCFHSLMEFMECRLHLNNLG